MANQKRYDLAYKIQAVKLARETGQTKAARNRMELIVRSLAEQNGVTEQLKAENQMEWVRQMNACKAQAEEVRTENCSDFSYIFQNDGRIFHEFYGII